MLKVSNSLDYINLINGGVVFGNDFKKIPKDYFAAVLDLMIYFSKKELECLVYLNYNSNNDYVITIPTQRVSKYRIKVNRESPNFKEIDLLTGNVIRPGLVRLGSIHSHHTFKANFSIEDDISDFTSPPGLHILIGEFPQLAIKACFALARTRYSINPCNVIDYTDSHSYSLSSSDNLHNVIKQQISILS